jgi:hypothetical protein
VPGQGSRFGRDAFHNVAIPTHRPNAEVEQLEARFVESAGEPLACDGHAYGVARALAQRPGGGFNAGGEMRLRVAGCAAVDLAETLNVVERNRWFFEYLALGVCGSYAGKVKRGVKEHGSVPGGKHEAVAIWPQGIGWIVVQEIVP